MQASEYFLSGLVSFVGVLVLSLSVTALLLRSARRKAQTRARAASLRAAADQQLDNALKSLNSLDEPRIKHFLALDEVSTMRLYSQTTTSAKAAKVREEETSNEIGRSGQFRIRLLGFDATKNRAQRIKETFEPESDPIKALVAVAKQLADDGSLRHVDLTTAPSARPVNQLLSNLEAQARQIGLSIPAAARVAIRQAWDASRNELTEGEVRKLGGFVKIKAEFLARYDESGDLILEASKESSNAARVVVAVRREWLTQAAETHISTDSTVRAICFGNVGQWNEKASSLLIIPIAVYSA
jgi:hypothetical protein